MSEKIGDEIKRLRAVAAQALEAFVSREGFAGLLERVHAPGMETVCGQAAGSSKALLAVEMALKYGKPVTIVVPEQSSAYLMLDDVAFFLSAKNQSLPVHVFPHLEILPYESQVPELTIRMERLAPIQSFLEIQNRSSDSTHTPSITIAPISAALKRLPPLSVYEQQALRLRKGDEINRDTLSGWLVEQGYEYRDLVAQRGDFSTRGDIADIYSFSYPDPVRIELWGDEIDSIRLFNVSTQRSIAEIVEAVFYPGNEDPLIEKALKEGTELLPLPALFGEETIVLLSDCDEVEKEGGKFCDLIQKRYWEVNQAAAKEDHELHLSEDDFHKHQRVLLEPPEKLYLDYEQWTGAICEGRGAGLTEFTLEPDPHHINLGCATPEIPGEDRKERIKNLIHLHTSGRRIIAVCDNTGQQSRLDEILEAQRNDLGLPPDAPLPETVTGGLHRGFVLLDLNILFCTDREIFGRYKRFRTPIQEGIALPIHDWLELKPGDYIVHIDHGIARFKGMKRMEHDGVASEYFELEYAQNGSLFVPIDQVDRIGRYVGGDEAAPTLSKLGTKNWERAKTRARQAIEDMAEELLDLYATRSIRKGHAFAKDTTWQHEFEASFLYEETADQWRAIEEVKRDMENSEPMDRMVCGDVGFGKTEVAIRAAFKTVMDGKQVAILAPTTILCQQHYNTFRERLADYPMQVEMLSRFLSAGQQKKIVERANEGDVDIIIGTHRLLSQDINFAELGLVIIDEEQRFGVKHKERLRQMRKLVDTLTLTATPIPRTLYMSLSGIRNMSLMSSPPKNRLPIETYIMEWSKEVIENAILRELSRDGQVYFVHNRVESIYQIAGMVQELVPNARICVGHGQMEDRELETVMMRFIRHEYDVLIATTIIENGLDIPNVNTIIINKADRFGLSQLYQLRGRVGRDRHRAYCYLVVPSKKALTAISRRRLLALQEHNQLGAGFQIAMRDMELRGIGNILGRQQHGHIAAIGFDLYSKLLSDTVMNLKSNKKLILEWDTAMEMAAKGSIPPTYVESAKQRMALHQRIAKIKTPEAIESLEAELIDIYGKPPAAVKKMVAGLRIRVRAHQGGFDLVQVQKRRGLLRYHVSQSERFDPMRILQMDGWEGLKLVVITEGDNVGIEFHDRQDRGGITDLVIPLIDALEADDPPPVEPASEPESNSDKPAKKKKRKIKKKIRRFT